MSVDSRVDVTAASGLGCLDGRFERRCEIDDPGHGGCRLDLVGAALGLGFNDGHRLIPVRVPILLGLPRIRHCSDERRGHHDLARTVQRRLERT